MSQFYVIYIKLQFRIFPSNCFSQPTKLSKLNVLGEKNIKILEPLVELLTMRNMVYLIVPLMAMLLVLYMGFIYQDSEEVLIILKRDIGLLKLENNFNISLLVCSSPLWCSI